MTQSEAFEAKLARSSDRTVVRSKFVFAATVGTTPSILLTISPTALGSRQAAVGTLFTDYKIQSLVLKFASFATAASFAVVGFLDDASGAEGDAPANTQDVSELRCSASNFTIETVPTFFQYIPVQKTWYKTFSGSTGSDQRLVVPSVLYGAANAANTGIQIEVDCVLAYKGAADTGSF